MSDSAKFVNTLQIGLTWAGQSAGGADRVFADLAASLPDLGVSFLGVVTGPWNLKETTGGLIHSFSAETASTVTRLRGARTEIGKLIDSVKPDLIASHFALYTAPILDRLRDQPFVSHFHGPWAMETRDEGASALSTLAKRTLESMVYKRADRLIVLSTAFADVLVKQYGIPEGRVRVVPGAVDLDRFRPVGTREQARRSLGWPTDRPILLSVRRLFHRMGLQQLVEAMARIRERVPDVLLCIGGIGPMQAQLAARVHDLKLSDNVQFLGFIPHGHLPLVYHAADITVLPTMALEGFGLVAAESLAAGTPAMVTPVGGLPAVVEKLSHNLIFRSGSPQDLASGLTAALRSEMNLPNSSECLAYAEQHFSRKLMAARVAIVYRELLNKSSGEPWP